MFGRATKTPGVAELARLLREGKGCRDQLESRPGIAYTSLDRDRAQTRLARLIDQARALGSRLSADERALACEEAGIGLDFDEALSIWEYELS